MGAHAHVTSVDHGADAMVKVAKTFHHMTLKVGILEKGGETYADGMTVGAIGTIHEFGLGVPERSFIRAWADENEGQIRSQIKKQLARVLKGELSAEAAWGQLGALFVGQIQKRIVDHIEPPLADSTIRAKGSSTPLIDTGVLKSSITFTVES